jgi:hypothetical protein
MSPRHFANMNSREQNNGWRFAHSDKEIWQILLKNLKIKVIASISAKVKKLKVRRR